MKRIIFSLVLFLTFCTQQIAHADVNTEMQNFFRSIGGHGTVNLPRYFNAQNRHVFSGGGINFRAPQRTFNLLSAQGPSLKAGCGGIDFYAGSFSFINKEEFVALLRNIAANSVGLAFKVALCSTSANLCQAIEDLQKTLESINRFNINSCETAKSIVGGVLGSSQRSSAAACMSVGRSSGLFSDDSDARARCADSSGYADAQSKAKSVGDNSNLPIEFVGGNITWQALQKVGGGIDIHDREFMMSLIGTQVVSTITLAIRHFPPTISEIADLQRREVEMLVCDEPVDCLNVRIATVTLNASFMELTRNRMEELKDRLSSGESLSPELINFISGSFLPVMQIIQADVAGAEGLINLGTEAVAYAITHRFLTETLRQATIATSAWRSRSANEANLTQQLIENTRELRRQLNSELHLTVSRLNEVLQLHTQVQGVRKQLIRSELTSTLPK